MPDWSPGDLLPGLYLAALAAGLGWTLRRWFDPVPARVWVAAALVVGLLCGPALVGGRIFLPLDSLRGEVPFRGLEPDVPHANPLQGDLLLLVTPLLARVYEEVGDGRWPLRDDRAGAGMPLLADPQAQALQPLALLALPLGPLAAAGFLAGLRILLALVFFHLLLRRQGLGEGASLCGALAYSLGGFLGLWLGWPLANAAAWLPALLYGLQRCSDPGERRDGILTAVAASGLVLAGQPDGVLFAVLLASAFFLVLLRRADAGRRRRLVVRVASAALVALLASAPALIPAGQLLPQTLRAARLEDRWGSDSDAPPAPPAVTRLVQAWLPVAAPNAFGNGRFGDPTGAVYWGRRNTNEDASGFAGTLMLLAAALALAAPRSRRRPHETWLGAALVVALLLMAEPPGIAALARLAPLGHLQRLNLVVNFALAWLGACELDRRFRGEGGRRGLLIGAGVLAVVLAWGTLAHAHPEHPEALLALRRGWLLLQGKVLVLATGLLLVAARARFAPAAAAFLVAAELLTAHAPAHTAAPRRLALPETPPVAYLRAHAGGSRVSALGGAFPPNLAGLYGLADARVYNPVVPAAYARLTAPLAEGEDARRLGQPGHPLYPLLGVRFLLTAPEAAVPPPLVRVLADPAGWVWEDPRARPLLTLPAPQRAPEVRLRRSARVSAAVEVAESRLLATTLYDDGGWRLLADGTPLPTQRVDGPLLAGRLPAGATAVDLVYRPPGFLAGVALAALAGPLALALWLPPPRRRRLTR